jgi:ribonuclease-3
MKDEELLIRALTHASYANLKNTMSYERLEFLGDGVLSLIVRDYIYREYDELAEGKLTKMQAALVCEATLSQIIAEIGLVKHIILVKDNSSDLPKRSIIADVYESILGAIYIDGGMESAHEFVMRTLKSRFELALEGKLSRDYKTEVQEQAQMHKCSVEYRLLHESGQAHDKTYVMQLFLDGKEISEGTGKSKKAAEQEAAREAIEAGVL